MGKSSARSIRQTDRMKERPDVHACMLYHHCSALMLVVRLATCTQLLHPPAQSVRDIPGKPTVEGVVAVLTCCSHQRGPGSTSRVSACPCWISSCGEDGVCTHEQGLHGGEPGWRYDGGLALGGLLRLHRRRLVRHGCLKEGRASGRQRASGRAQPGNITLCLLVELIWRPHRTHTASTSYRGFHHIQGGVAKLKKMTGIHSIRNSRYFADLFDQICKEGKVPIKRHTRVRSKPEVVSALVRWILSDENVQTVSWTKKKAYTDNKKIEDIPCLSRKRSKEAMWRSYCRAFPDASKRVQHTSFMRVTRALTGKQQRAVQAVDYLKVELVYSNRDRLERLVREVVDVSLRKRIITEMREVFSYATSALDCAWTF